MKRKIINLFKFYGYFLIKSGNYKLLVFLKCQLTIKYFFWVFARFLLLQSSFIMSLLESPKEPRTCKLPQSVETVKHWVMMNAVFVFLKKRNFKFQSLVVILFVANVCLTFMTIQLKSLNAPFVEKKLTQFLKFLMMDHQVIKKERFQRK